MMTEDMIDWCEEAGEWIFLKHRTKKAAGGDMLENASAGALRSGLLPSRMHRTPGH